VSIINVSFPKTETPSYDIFIKNGVLNEIGEKVKQLPVFEKVKTFAVVTDTNVSALYEKTVADSLINAGFNVISFSIPPGEKSKNATQYFALQGWLAENQITRSDAIIALGGGVVGDLTGFTSATYLRGVPFVQVPTTLLSMVDSSVGGKTGIDIPAGKNLVGAFYQPSMVLCDPLALNTLTSEVFADGCAEVIKHGMIRCKKLLKTLQDTQICENSSEIIAENIKIKRDIVQNDQFDTGERQLLNLGHTIGHALEKLSNFKISHGNAVAIGMSIITRAAVKKNLCPPQCLDTLQILLKKYNLPAIKPVEFSANDIYQAALSDKKRMGDTITEVIPRALGECVLYKMPVAELLEWII
jgi:3-dehydroquinate synthase